MHDFDAFFAATTKRAAPRYRWRNLTFRFFRSVGNTTPNAFAQGWTIAYNVHGSIDTNPDQTRETLFHEIFHLDDADHGDWSPRHLASIQDAILRRCGTSTPCLTPYAPTSTIVRRGTYYAFQPGNDVHEYAAEVALRWYREQRAMVRGSKGPCAPRSSAGPRRTGAPGTQSRRSSSAGSTSCRRAERLLLADGLAGEEVERRERGGRAAGAAADAEHRAVEERHRRPLGVRVAGACRKATTVPLMGSTWSTVLMGLQEPSMLYSAHREHGAVGSNEGPRVPGARPW